MCKLSKEKMRGKVKFLESYWIDRLYKFTPAPMPAKENNEMTALVFGERLLTTAYSFMISTLDRRQVCLLHHGRCIITFWPCHDWIGINPLAVLKIQLLCGTLGTVSVIQCLYTDHECKSHCSSCLFFNS